MDIQYRFLSKENYLTLYETNIAAFVDYLVPVKMTKEQFDNHIAQNAVDINLCVGAFANEKMVGYTMNGFGIWNGEKTAYDAGTGVLPEYRRQGIGKSIFKFLLPKLKKMGTEQMLLEVLSNNKKAINLYRKLGFKQTRKLLFFEQTETIEKNSLNKFKIRQIDRFEWEKMEFFGEGKASWQFSNESIKRKLAQTKFFGAFSDDKCIGFALLFPSSGIVPQIVVEKNHRQKGIAKSLLAKIQNETIENKKLRLSNIDSNLKNLIKFADKLKFKPTISQYEMTLKL